MPASILSTKLYIPPLPSKLIPRPRLIEKLNQGIKEKLTIISAPAGPGNGARTISSFGKGVAYELLKEKRY